MADVFNNKYMNKKKRNLNLAIAPNPKTTQSKRSKMVDDAGDYEAGSHSVGRLSYAMKCKQKGCFIQTCVEIRKFRTDNPDSSFMSLWTMLHNKFPYIFEKETKDMYAGNIQRMIDAEPEWAKSYYSPAGDLVSMAKYRIERMLEKDDIDDNVVIKAYDTLMKYNMQDNENVIAFSEETNDTLNSIAQGLRELSAGDDK